jgi:hypothetical protein
MTYLKERLYHMWRKATSFPTEGKQRRMNRVGGVALLPCARFSPRPSDPTERLRRRQRLPPDA